MMKKILSDYEIPLYLVVRHSYDKDGYESIYESGYTENNMNSDDDVYHFEENLSKGKIRVFRIDPIELTEEEIRKYIEKYNKRKIESEKNRILNKISSLSEELKNIDND